MKKSPWHKIHNSLYNFYFISNNKMIVRLLYVNEYVAVYRIIRNNKIVTTFLDNFVYSFSIINYKRHKMSNTNSGITGYVNTKTSITLKFASGDAYRYDLSKSLSKTELAEMVKLAEQGSGLNTYLNKNAHIRKYGYIDETLTRDSSFHKYG